MTELTQKVGAAIAGAFAGKLTNNYHPFPSALSPEAAEVLAQAAIDAMPDVNQELVEALRDLMAAAPAFRSKPMGGEGSPVRRQQTEHIAAEDRARSALSMARKPAA